MRRFSVRHTTAYNYSGQVSSSQNMATLRPRPCLGQELLDYTIEINPQPKELSERVDFFGNYITRFSLQGRHQKLVVTTRSKLIRDYAKLHAQFYEPKCQGVLLGDARDQLKSFNPQLTEAKQFMLESIFIRKTGASFREYAARSFQENRSVFDASYELMQRIYTDFDFVPGFTNVSTPIQEVMTEKKGVCQDFAQVGIACVRSMGIPARYVSGYIETVPPEGQEKLIGADASHAWFSVFIPGYGWVDFDPTNNQIPGDQHLVVGWGRDYYDVPPLKGVVYGSGKSKLKVSVDISQLADEAPKSFQ
ncbi:MAG: transglutaminase family protein [Leeuwenhoekiella sp.]